MKRIVSCVWVLGLLLMAVAASAGETELDSSALGEFELVEVSGDYAYLTTSEGLFVSVDVTDPAAPDLADTLWLPANPSDIIKLHELSYILTVEDDSGLCVIDITDPAALVLAEYNTTYPVDLIAQDINGGNTTRLYMSEGDDVWIVDFTAPDGFNEVGAFTGNGIMKGLDANSQKLYASARMDGLTIYDVSDPVNPTELGLYDEWVNYLDITDAADPGYLLTLTSQGETGEMGVLDISDPGAPSQLGYYSQYGGYGTMVQFYAVAQWADRYALLPITWEPEVEDDAYYLYLIDFEDQTSPNELWSVELEEEVVAVALDDDATHAFVAGDRECLIYDLTTPAAPALVGQFPGHSTVDDREAVRPTAFGITDVFPNPFNSTAKISFELTTTQQVRLSVFDVTGRLVGVAVDEVREAGVHTIEFSGTHLASGTYILRLEGDGRMDVGRMTLVK